MNRLCLFLLTVSLLVPVSIASAQDADAQPAKAQPIKEARPRVEVVFCLDTTGSMGGLINAAKQKIWAICNQISTGTPTPDLRVGLVAFRDRKDEYVTKIFDLTDNLDEVYENLMGFKAQGGGDFPESVNQALHESVTKINWSKEGKALKIVFLVGDAPPHMDYKDDVKYPETCQIAVKADIIINTIQCGKHQETKKYWQDICHLAEGSYVQIDQDGGSVLAIATPFDKDLAKINSELTDKTLVFGTSGQQMRARQQQGLAKGLEADAAAERAGFYANSNRAASYDLVENLRRGKVKLEDLKKEELPKELQGKTLEEQKEYLGKLEKERAELNQKAVELNKKRQAYIAEKQAAAAKNRGRDSFDNQVLTILQRQATRINVRYETPTAPEKKKD